MLSNDIILSLIQGSFETLMLAGVSCILGLLLGLILTFLQYYSKFTIVKMCARGLCLLTQCLPEILILFSVYFGASTILTFLFKQESEIPGFMAAIITLSLIFASYASKIFYTASLQIQKSECEAAFILKLSKLQIFYFIIWPQLWRYAFPGLGSLWLIMLKDTVLVSLIGGSDLMSRSQIIIHNSHQPFKFYFIISCIYLAITMISEKYIKKVTQHA